MVFRKVVPTWFYFIVPGSSGEDVDSVLNRNIFLPVFLFFSLLRLLPAQDIQEIVTASVFFNRVSQRYMEIEDYQAVLTITQEDSVMTGKLYHKRPNFLLIEFDEPKDQVIAVDGEKLIIYIPYLNVSMEQRLKPEGPQDPTGASLATGQGLELMKNRYSIAYLDSQFPVPLNQEYDELGNLIEVDEPAGSEADEMVYKLKLEWKTIDEGFRQLILSIDEDLMIRRISGVASSFQEIELDFEDIIINQNLPEGKFRYVSPPTANVINNFIFVPEEE
ncbi:MAG: outer membrane lipoprotein carrier protein LolA [Spirochaetales bacterium]|nr:outer membrane lipoprotein carrier protein LolA [Spirochaetales bacterium]